MASAQDAVVPDTQPPPTITRVEEDWMVWVYEPDGNLYAPQFHTVMSPVPGLDSYYFQVTWNYHELPNFWPGGFQVQGWRGEEQLAVQDVDRAELSSWAETIRWTQVMETNGNQIAFSVMNGSSTSWGTFGHPDTTIVQDGSVSNLDQYSPDESVANSWITYGQNRVIVLMISEVRYYSEGTLVKTDDTPRYLYVNGQN